MSFLNPWMLIGLAGALVPIIIHLLHKQRPRRQPFPAIELLLKSIERVERRWRLRRFLLLAMRVLLLAALALAAAGPRIGVEAKTPEVTRGPTRVGIVIDASLSMRTRYEGVSSFTHAIREARRAIEELGPEDQAILVVAKGRPELLVPRPTLSKLELLEALAKLEPTYEAADIGEACSLAAQALGSSREAADEDRHAMSTGSRSAASASPSPSPSPSPPPVPARIVVFSDLARSSFQGASDLSVPGSASLAQLEVIDVLADIVPADERHNRAVVHVDAQRVPGRAAGMFEFRTRVSSFSKRKEENAAPIDITLKRLDEDLDSSSLDFAPGGTIDKVLRHAFESPGIMRVEVVLEHDQLAEDDIHYLTVDVERQVRTLIVDGAPSGVPKEDEIFYLERALAAGAADQPQPRIITIDDLPQTDLLLFDVVILAGVSSLSAGEASRVVEFVQRGGGLLITASEDIDAELYNAGLGPILPRPLRGMKMLEGGALGPASWVEFEEVMTNHPIMEVFQGTGMGGLLSTRTRGLLLLEPGSGGGGIGSLGAAGGRSWMDVLISFQDGQPALVASEAGQGRVIILATSVDRDLTDLPIRPAFVPLMRRVLLHLGRALSKPEENRALVGQAQILPIPRDVTEVSITGPNNRAWRVSTLALPNQELRFEETHQPGHYTVEISAGRSNDALEIPAFSINVDPREADLDPFAPEEARAVILGTSKDEVAADSGSIRARSLHALAGAAALPNALLLLMVLAFVIEGALLARRTTS